jgi:hypothetical protein
MSRSAIQKWAESFTEALVRRATHLGAGHGDPQGPRAGEIVFQLQSAVMRYESLVFGGPDLSWGRAREEDVAALPRPPVSSGRLVCVAACFNVPLEHPEAWDFGAGVALIHDEEEAAAFSFGRSRRTLSVSYTEGQARIGFGEDMQLLKDVPERHSLAPPEQRVSHPFWALARCMLSEEGVGTCFLEGHRVASRGMSPESNIISVFRRALGLYIENEFGESSWHDLSFCALARHADALERWRRAREPAVRAKVGDSCPRCRGRLEDADYHELPTLLGGQQDSARRGSFLRLRCSLCTTLYRTSGRRIVDIGSGQISYSDRMS